MSRYVDQISINKTALIHNFGLRRILVHRYNSAETYAGALLEVLVHVNLFQPPKNHKVVRILDPDEVGIEVELHIDVS
jgi:hypothetical protein